MSVLLVDGTTLKIEAVSRNSTTTQVFNFSVEGLETYFVGEAGVLVHNCGIDPKDYDAGSKPVRIAGPWSIDDLERGLQGRSPDGLGNPEIHHGGQMSGGALHEIVPYAHKNTPGLHLNKYNQGVTNVMRASDRDLHWWYRAREMGADQIMPDRIYD